MKDECLAQFNFVTGSKLVTGYTMYYDFENLPGNKINFTFVEGTTRDFHDGDETWNGNGTLIRPGARYQV